MKTLLTSLTAILIAIILSENVYSQGSFFIHAGPSFPLSDFGDVDWNDDGGGDAGGASVGLNLGCKYIYELNNKGLGLFLGADFNLNGLKSSEKDQIKGEGEINDNIDIKYYKYINVPIIGGLNYTFKANEQVALFVDLGIGADFFKVTNMTMESANEEWEIKFHLSSRLAYKFGGGLLIQDKYIIGLNYNVLGKHDAKAEIEYNGDTLDPEDFEKKVDILTLTFGIKF